MTYLAMTDRVTHGLASTYRAYGCHCEPCRAAHLERHKAENSARSERLQADPSLAPHGKWTTYNNWGCRCDACRAASTAHRKATRKRTQP